MSTAWEFWVDVGGTFTDCIARAPDGRLLEFKTLSSGVTKGVVERVIDARGFVDPLRRGDPPAFWNGYLLRLLEAGGAVRFETRVTDFDAPTCRLMLAEELPVDAARGTPYELSSGEEAPLVAVRYLLGLRLDDPIPPVTLKLGTTRGTNALLTRTGARTALVTTRGFADVLLIGNQDRPRLFDLAIRKPEPIFERVVEIDERLDADGRVLRAPDEAAVRRQLTELRGTGVDSVGICLLHAYANSAHELVVEQIAREVGFREVSTSSRLAPLIKIVSRGDTAVMDAYLNPVLRVYVRSVQDALARNAESQTADAGRSAVAHASGSSAHASGPATEESQRPARGARRSILKIMTSSGGLVDADRFVGKDSILSGPAGGVVGFSRVAQRAGFTKSIGFDMGGTSTDVSRFDGRYEMEFETAKAGVRVVAPMLAIETVAAGGGSICEFDGVKLTVGPASAGADPGPACYGRGGPLTVTDVNLFLGKILPSRFPFPLDRAAVERRLQMLCERIAGSPMGRRYAPHELAEGFVSVANANMVRAIRRISVAKGYDPADYVLVTFGGAGAQHACAMARELGIRRILVHPYAGILSAYGIGLADVRRFAEHSVLQPYSPETLAQLEPLFRNLEQRTRAEVLAEGLLPEQVRPPLRSLDMRYRGVEAVINVPCPTDGNYAARYEELHRQLYGYVHAGRPLEITAARVEVIGGMAEPPEATAVAVPRRPLPRETVETWFDGRPHPTGVFDRADLHAGDEITGPAIVCEPTSTVVIDPGCGATVLERGELLIGQTRAAQACRGEREPSGDSAQQESREREQPGGTIPHSAFRIPHSTAADPIRLEIFNNLFASIAEQMGLTLKQTSVSTNVKERLDFSCAIFSAAGDLVVNAPHIPVHLGAMSETVKRVLADNPAMRPGDVYVTNDPYRGGSHLPDVTVVTPVHHGDTGELLFFTASRAHHAEIGGIVPGSMPPFSANLAEEGVVIRNFKLVDGGRSREEELRQLLLSGPYPTRSVGDNLADIAAQVAANNAGVRLLGELVARYSLPVVQAYMGHIQRAAAQKMRMALAKIPDGEYAWTDHLDNGAAIAVRVTIAGQRATVDFTGTSPPLRPPAGSPNLGARAHANAATDNAPAGAPGSYNLNANRAIVTAAVLYVFRCMIDEDIPLNSGVLEPVEIILPECLLNPPAHDDPAQCPAVVGGNVETSQRVVDTLLGALKLAAASQGTMNNLTFGDQSFGYYETIGGGSGATPQADGADAVHTHMTNTRLTDVEVIERRYPVRVLEFSIRRGSGGSGGHRGGDGIVRRIEFLRPLKVSILSERRGPYPPFGLNGGSPGRLGRNTLTRAGSGTAEDLGGKVALDVAAGDVLTVETPGGGGWGET